LTSWPADFAEDLADGLSRRIQQIIGHEQGSLALDVYSAGVDLKKLASALWTGGNWVAELTSPNPTTRL
jgi:hypothetical protein